MYLRSNTSFASMCLFNKYYSKLLVRAKALRLDKLFETEYNEYKCNTWSGLSVCTALMCIMAIINCIFSPWLTLFCRYGLWNSLFRVDFINSQISWYTWTAYSTGNIMLLCWQNSSPATVQSWEQWSPLAWDYAL